MIVTVDDFFNKLANDIRNEFFANENHFDLKSHNENYSKANYSIELFNNGCLTYSKLISSLKKACNSTTERIHDIVKKHIVSFGDYKFNPK